MFWVFWVHFRFDFPKHSGWVSGYDPEIGHILCESVSNRKSTLIDASNLGDNAASTNYYTSAQLHARKHLHIAANPAVLSNRYRFAELRAFGSVP